MEGEGERGRKRKGGREGALLRLYLAIKQESGLKVYRE